VIFFLKVGLVNNSRQFNVAVTRAKSLLIIVGNPDLLVRDPYWAKVLGYCVQKGSYQGCPLDPDMKMQLEELMNGGKHEDMLDQEATLGTEGSNGDDLFCDKEFRVTL